MAIVSFGLLPSLSWAEPSIPDDRVLRVRDGSSARQYALGDLVAAIGLTELEVAKDPHFGDRVFAGFELGALLEHVGLGDAPELLLVCQDGYSIPFEASMLSQSALQALLAVRDTALPVGGEAHWAEFRHGSELIDFDPFYLVWASSDASIDLGTEVVPWPFQLTEIRRFDRARYFAPARPTTSAGEDVRAGFATYTAHCGKCHRMRGVGGELGPALDRQGSLASVFTTAQLRDYVRHDGTRYPQSKMPQFSNLLSPAEIDQVVAYLQAMQPGR